jgi:hypothetical protein
MKVGYHTSPCSLTQSECGRLFANPLSPYLFYTLHALLLGRRLAHLPFALPCAGILEQSMGTRNRFAYRSAILRSLTGQYDKELVPFLVPIDCSKIQHWTLQLALSVFYNQSDTHFNQSVFYFTGTCVKPTPTHLR